MTGYQEVLTDPSYAGQIVAMTYPQIGNYGVNRGGRRVGAAAGGGLHRARGVAGASRRWRARARSRDYLDAHGIVGISEIDTRALMRHLRTPAPSAASSRRSTSTATRWWRRRARSRSMIGLDLAREVTCAKP